MVYSGIGGQAVMEGVMMKSDHTMAIAVRDPKGTIQVETKPVQSQSGGFRKVPLIRGVLTFVDSFTIGMPALMHSAEVSTGEEEEELTHNEILGVFAVAMLLAVGLFMGVPFVLSRLLAKVVTSNVLLAFLEGLIRLGIFIGYVLLIGRMDEISRVFRYHGAEHKCINCIEHGLPLTVENVRASSRQHKRCGTSFLVFVLLISVVLFMFVRFDSPVLQLAARILLLPVIAGISYEFLRLAGRSDSGIMRVLSVPGMLVQNLTTAEPDDAMIEVGIASVEASFDWRHFLREHEQDFGETQAAQIEEWLTEEENRLRPTRQMLLHELTEQLQGAGVPDADVDARLVLMHVTGLSATDMAADGDVRVTEAQAAECRRMAAERAERKPLQYILGEQGFMDYTFSCRPGVLIPRQDTEHLVEAGLLKLEERMNAWEPEEQTAPLRVLDLCTGSGCVLLSVLGEWQKRHPEIAIEGCGTDLSDTALALARENAARLDISADFRKADLFGTEECWDVILANPPYIASGVIETLMPEVRDYEPREALDGGDDGLTVLRRIAAEAPNHLNAGGWLLTEIGFDQGQAVRTLFEEAGLTEVSIKKDYARDDRVVLGQWVQTENRPEAMLREVEHV